MLDAKGGHLETTSGFFLAPRVALVSFSGLNAGHLARIAAPATASGETGDVLSWNRREDWAILRFAAATGPVPPRAASPPQVGDRCFFLDAQGEAGRVILETAVVGLSDNGDLFLGERAGEASFGSPVLNEFGQVVAVVAGSRSLGDVPGDGLAYARMRGGAPRGTRARPVPALPAEDAASRSLDDLARTGVFVRPLVRRTS